MGRRVDGLRGWKIESCFTSFFFHLSSLFFLLSAFLFILPRFFLLSSVFFPLSSLVFLSSFFVLFFFLSFYSQGSGMGRLRRVGKGVWCKRAEAGGEGGEGNGRPWEGGRGKGGPFPAFPEGI